MSILQVDNLHHSFGDKQLYTGAAFTLNKGERMGVIGQNGTGKSTLLKIVLGEIIPDQGEIVWEKGIEIGHIDQYSDTDGNSSILDYLRTAYQALFDMESTLQSLYASLGTDPDEALLRRVATLQTNLEESGFYDVDTRIQRVAAGLALDVIGLERTLDTLSGGQRTKVILAKLLLAQPDVLLMDEPTNFLDAEHIAWLSDYLREYKGTVLLVSHDFDFLDRVATCICDLEFHVIHKYYGKYSDFLRQKEHRREEYQRRYIAQQKETARLEDYIARNKVRAATAKMARSRQKQLDKMEKLAPPSVLPRPNIRFAAQKPFYGKVLRVKRLSIGYGRRPLLPEISFTLMGGEKTVITGFNGIGKSTLLKTLVGEIQALGGFYAFAPGIQVGYFEQDFSWEQPELTPLQLLDRDFPGLRQKELRSHLSRCGVQAKQAMQPLSSLSGGEQNKVKLCYLTMQKFHFLLLDEPTNHLDAETKASLQQAIREYDGTVIMVCHEREFYAGWVDRVINIEDLLQEKSI